MANPQFIYLNFSAGTNSNKEGSAELYVFTDKVASIGIHKNVKESRTYENDYMAIEISVSLNPDGWIDYVSWVITLKEDNRIIRNNSILYSCTGTSANASERLLFDTINGTFTILP